MRAVPGEPPLDECALDGDHEAAGPAVVMGRAPVSRAPAGEHDLNLVVGAQNGARVWLSLVWELRPLGQGGPGLHDAGQQLRARHFATYGDCGQGVEQRGQLRECVAGDGLVVGDFGHLGFLVLEDGRVWDRASVLSLFAAVRQTISPQACRILASSLVNASRGTLASSVT